MSLKQWLKPVEALTRFKPPQNIQFAGDENPDDFTIRYGYRIGDHAFLVKSDARSEVVDDHPIHPVPLTESFVRGMINLRGNLVAVFDLNPLLSSVNEPTQSGTVLIIGDNGDEVGILVDGVPRAIYDTGQHVDPPPTMPAGFHEFVHDAISSGGTNWLEFDCQGYFRAHADHQLDVSHG